MLNINTDSHEQLHNQPSKDTEHGLPDNVSMDSTAAIKATARSPVDAGRVTDKGTLGGACDHCERLQSPVGRGEVGSDGPSSALRYTGPSASLSYWSAMGLGPFSGDHSPCSQLCIRPPSETGRPCSPRSVELGSCTPALGQQDDRKMLHAQKPCYTCGMRWGMVSEIKQARGSERN